PDQLVDPREVKMFFRVGDDRPTLVADRAEAADRTSRVVRYSPIAEESSADGEPDSAAQASASLWSESMLTPSVWSGRLWDAACVDDHVVVGIERYRPRSSVAVDTYLLREDQSIGVGPILLPVGEGARWSLVPWRRSVALVAAPRPAPETPLPESTPETVALLSAVTLNGQPVIPENAADPTNPIVSIYEKPVSAMDGNADLLIQIIALVAAMTTMVMFYRRAPRADQIDLPDHLALASFSRRALAGMIDLAPGFWLATLLYDVTINETVLYAWPGNGVEKAFAAMRPGFVVIGVTLVHTTIMEFIFARSIGKFAMGLYVADLRGKPAPPGPSLGRAVSRVFELFAPLMIIIAVVSPARQRLGDILAKTTVVMAKPKPPEEQDRDDDRD
ncbi:MAG: RDD family protein, partial [Phycisphaeraceae bacterium]